MRRSRADIADYAPFITQVRCFQATSTDVVLQPPPPLTVLTVPPPPAERTEAATGTGAAMMNVGAAGANPARLSPQSGVATACNVRVSDLMALIAQ